MCGEDREFGVNIEVASKIYGGEHWNFQTRISIRKCEAETLKCSTGSPPDSRHTLSTRIEFRINIFRDVVGAFALEFELCAIVSIR
jgi:hypothetical protein